MRDEHIIAILESTSFARLSESELATVRAHARGCATCRRASEAARLSSILLTERASVEVEPSPFFQTRVMAALRERRAGVEAFSFGRMWKAARALVSSMAATVALLAGLTLVAPVTQTTDGMAEGTTVSDPFSAEEMVFARDETAGDEMTYEQVLTTIYETED